MKKVEEVELPVNPNERFLYAIAMRLEIIIEQLSGLSDHIAKRDGVATEGNIASTQVEETKPKRTRKQV